MSALSDIESLLNEEKLRAAIDVAELQKCDALLDGVKAEDAMPELGQKCDEYLNQNPKSIYGLYFKGLHSYFHGDIEGGAFSFQRLINMFRGKEEWKLLKHTSERALKFGNNKAILKARAAALQALNENALLPQVWKEIVRIDHSETEYAEKLYDYYFEQGRYDDAAYYQNILIREYIDSKDEPRIEKAWKRLIELDRSDYENYIDLANQIYKNGMRKRASSLLNDLYNAYTETENYSVMLRLLKKIAEINSDEKDLRTNLELVYNKLYEAHSHRDDFLQNSGLTDKRIKVLDAIDEFEKKIRFDEGGYVEHRSWGIGEITDFRDNRLTINFSKGRKGHQMSLDMALNSLTPLPANHLNVKNAFFPEELDELVKEVTDENVLALARIVLHSTDEPMGSKEFKKMLCPALIAAKGWTRWWTRCKDVLRRSTDISEVKKDTFVMRDDDQPIEQELHDRFKSGDVGAKSSVFEELAELHSGDETKQSAIMDMKKEMRDKLVEIVNAADSTTAEKTIAYVSLAMDTSDHPEGADDIPAALTMEDMPLLVPLLPSKKFKFLMEAVRQQNPDWARMFQHCVENQLDNSQLFMLKALAKDQPDLYRETAQAILNSYNLNSVLVFAKALIRGTVPAKPLDMTPEDLYVVLFRVVEKAERDIKNSREVNENKKILRMVESFIFDKKNKTLEKYITDNPQSRVLELLENTRYVDAAEKLHLLNKFKDLDMEPAVVSEAAATALLVSRQAYEKRLEELNHMKSVEMPAVSQEIATAREYGDLKENAEYHAAREKQGMLTREISVLEKQFEDATIIDPDDVDTTTISFGCRFKLINTDTGEEVVYTLLGPWEADASRELLSYTSPLGDALLGKKPEETFEFKGNHYTVSSSENGLTDYQYPES